MAEENKFVSFICVSCKQEIEAANIRIELPDL